MSLKQTYNSGWTEADASNRITITNAYTLTIAGLDDGDTAYISKDFTANYFSGDFDMSFSFNCTTTTGATSIVYLWGMTDALANLYDQADHLGLYWTYNSASSGTLTLEQKDGAAAAVTDATSAGLCATSTPYYVRMVRDMSVGTNGTLYAYIYADAEHTTLVDTLAVLLTEATAGTYSFQYLIGFCGYGTNTGNTVWAGTVSDLCLDTHPYTYETMLTKVRYCLNESTAGFYTDAYLQGLINDGIRDIARLGECIRKRDAVATTSSTRTVAFTGYKCHAVEYTDSTPKLSLRHGDPRKYGRGNPNGTYPYYWYHHGAAVSQAGARTINIGIDPLPDSTYNLAAYISDYPTTDLSVASQVPEIPPPFRPLVIKYVVYQALLKAGKVTAAEQVKSIYMNELMFMARDLLDIIPDGKKDMNYNA